MLLYRACQHGDLEQVKHLLSEGASPVWQHQHRSVEGQTCFFALIDKDNSNRIEVLHMLIAHCKLKKNVKKYHKTLQQVLNMGVSPR